jgi:very-short-patch-repair endonuclease
MRRKIIRYNPEIKQKARILRNNSTLGEVLAWKKLSGKQLLGYDFHRPKPIDQFIAANCFSQKKLMEAPTTLPRQLKRIFFGKNV